MEVLTFNTDRAKELAKSKNVTFKEIAKEIGISRTCLSIKINNGVPFTVDEIVVLSHMLGVTADNLYRVFYGIQ